MNVLPDPKTWHQAMELCYNEGKELCAAPLSMGVCKGKGCSYDLLYQWSTTQCEQGDANYPEACEPTPQPTVSFLPTLVPTTAQPTFEPTPLPTHAFPACGVKLHLQRPEYNTGRGLENVYCATSPTLEYVLDKDEVPVYIGVGCCNDAGVCNRYAGATKPEVARPVAGTSTAPFATVVSVQRVVRGWSARGLQRLASWRATPAETEPEPEPEPEPEC